MLIDEKFKSAFHALDLNITATKQEVEEQLKLLIKMYETANIGSMAKIKKAKEAAKLLITQYFING